MALRFLAVCLTLFTLFAGACSPKKPTPKTSAPDENLMESMPIPRADPAYMQYLERLSLLANAGNMAKVVSGSELAWRAPAVHETPEQMLAFSDLWLKVNPRTMLTNSRRAAFDTLNDSAVLSIMREISAKGLYAAPLAGSGRMWTNINSGTDTGEDIVQYDFSPAAGKEPQYRRMMQGLLDGNMLMGSDLVPAATGLGPDFLLAARGIREYPGIYCMVEVPRDLWTSLPPAAKEWDAKTLDDKQIEALSAKGLLPRSMRDDHSVGSVRGGWAATGEVRGVDGNTRRWVYRFHGSPDFAVLNWEDPSQSAHRILSGSAVRQVGLLGQALVGLKFEAFQGLEAAAPGASAASAFSVEPALSAAQSMSREIRRYGGWSWLRDDNLPISAVNDFLRAGTDFVADSVFSPAAEHALLTGDAGFLRFMSDEALRLGVETRRLVHTTPDENGMDYNLPHLSYIAYLTDAPKAKNVKESILAGASEALAPYSPSPLYKNTLYTTGPGLAAMAMGIKQGDTAALQKSKGTIQDGHMLLLFFKAMQPGALMISGQDATGALPLYWSGAAGHSGTAPSDLARGAYPLTSSSASLMVTTQGLPKTQTLYGPADSQVHDDKSPLREMGKMLRFRAQTGVAKGELTDRPATKGRGAVALVTRMPDGKSYMLTICNFSRDATYEEINLARIPGLSKVASSQGAYYGNGKFHVEGSTCQVTLGPWQAKAILFGNPPAAASSAPSGGPKDKTADANVPDFI